LAKTGSSVDGNQKSHDSKDLHTIVSATTTPNTDSVIYIWQYKPSKPASKRQPPKNAISWANSMCHTLLQIIITFAAVAFLYQNIDWIAVSVLLIPQNLMLTFIGKKAYISVLQTEMSSFASKSGEKAQTLWYAERQPTSDNSAVELEALKRLLLAMELEKSVLQQETREEATGSVKQAASPQEVVQSNSKPVLTDSGSAEKTVPVAYEGGTLRSDKSGTCQEKGSIAWSA
jgi:hypothetical protein